MDVQGFLEHLGQRLRQSRERRSLSVTEAAKAAGVSRRYLTEAEAGRANPSILVLGRLAAALGIELPELLAIQAPTKKLERVALVGLRGAGKSSVGRHLARTLETPFVELDRRVEELAGLSLAEIFDLHGSEGFHRFEARALERVLSEGERVVIATGGSIVTSEPNYRRLLDTCRTVWLRAQPHEHFQRVLEQGDRRPMQDDPSAMDQLREILRRREPQYEQCEVTLDTSGREPAALADTIVAALGLGV